MNAKDIDLSGQVAFVTGGGGGIGRASALSLAEMGVDIAILESIPERCDETTALIEKLGVTRRPWADTPVETAIDTASTAPTPRDGLCRPRQRTHVL